MTKLADGVWGWAGAEKVNAACAAVSRVRLLAQNVRRARALLCARMTALVRLCRGEAQLQRPRRNRATKSPTSSFWAPRRVQKTCTS